MDDLLYFLVGINLVFLVWGLVELRVLRDPIGIKLAAARLGMASFSLVALVVLIRL